MCHKDVTRSCRCTRNTKARVDPHATPVVLEFRVPRATLRIVALVLPKCRQCPQSTHPTLEADTSIHGTDKYSVYYHFQTSTVGHGRTAGAFIEFSPETYIGPCNGKDARLRHA